MARDLGYLAKRMGQLAKKVERNADKAVRDTVNAIAPVLVYATPVQTSRARANWQGSINAPITTVLYGKPDKPPTVDSGATMGITSLKAAAVAYRPGSTVYMVNNVPYIGKLNRGSSAQAPAGFVLLAVLTGARTIRKARLLK
jgi:hypothetical protein